MKTRKYINKHWTLINQILIYVSQNYSKVALMKWLELTAIDCALAQLPWVSFLKNIFPAYFYKYYV